MVREREKKRVGNEEYSTCTVHVQYMYSVTSQHINVCDFLNSLHVFIIEPSLSPSFNS